MVNKLTFFLKSKKKIVLYIKKYYSNKYSLAVNILKYFYFL